MRENFNDLSAFVTVAREESFTRAAVRLGVSQSALSHTIRSLETRLGIRLLTRTTRSVSPTEAGERLLSTLGPRFDEIDAELAALTELREKPAGTIRLNASEYAAHTVLWPKLEPFLADYPDINLEISVDNGLVDIVAQRYDAGVRLGDNLQKDMVAVRIAPDMAFALVAAPGYLSRHAQPRTPQELANHQCINLRMPTQGTLYAWELRCGDQAYNARVNGRLVFNSNSLIIRAAVAGFGIAFMPCFLLQEHLDSGALQPLLQEWWPTFPGYHLYYPSRRQSSTAFNLMVDALRHPS
jgi:DNA-binding transcriptional LysR family regulator